MKDDTSRARWAVRYIVIETLTNTGISIALSIVFALLFFRGQQRVDLGSQAVVLDLMPQSLAVGLMSFLVPTLLTRQRRRSGKLEVLQGQHVFPRNVFLRSAVVGIVTAVVCTAAYAIFKPSPGLFIQPLSRFVALKGAFGAILSMVLTPVALFAALKDPN